jgi:predicted AlkP superfamily pyrophosphatase or phosphodiesterase
MRQRGRLTPILVLASLLATAGCTSQADSDTPGNNRRPADVARDRCPSNFKELVANVRRGYFPGRSTDISLIPREPNYVGSSSMPVHSGPWDYLTHVPIVLYGPGHIAAKGRIGDPATMADLAPTAAELIDFNGFPARDGRVLNEALAPSSGPPALVVSVVWDGGGYNVLRTHEGRWPFLAGLMRKGTSYTNASIGSSPSTTPPIHATLGTGAWPNSHGISGLNVRIDGEYVDPLGGFRADYLVIPTLADLYDLAAANVPVTGMLGSVSWHLGMIGHGTAIDGADADPVASLSQEDATIDTNTDVYSVPDISEPDAQPRFAQKLDIADGRGDETWRGHSLETPEDVHFSPAQSGFEEYMLERLVVSAGFGADEVPDLLYVNFKTTDVLGHRYGMTSPEVGDALEAQDAAIRRFVEFLDRRVGARRWVLMLTADHGQTPYPRESGAFPIGGGEITRDTNERFDRTDDGIDLADRTGSPGMYVVRDQLRANHVTMERIAKWLAGYTVGENVREDFQLPAAWEGRADERLFDGILVRDRLAAVSCGTSAGGR